MARPLALVTGASAGIGEAYARLLARDGYDLVLVARRGDRLKTTAQTVLDAYGARTEILTADLGDPAGLKAVEARLAASPPVDLLVNNAGFGVYGSIETLDPETMDEMVRVNATALMRLTRAAVPGMLERGHGTIINVSSGSVFIPIAGMTIYMATKSFIMGFTRALHLDVGSRGIQVQALIPGLIETEFGDRSGTNLADYDRSMIMSSDELVEGSLAGLKIGEMVCIPSLPDYDSFRRFEAAEVEIVSGVSKDRIAARYRS